MAAQHEQLFLARGSVSPASGPKAGGRDEHVKPTGIGQRVTFLCWLGLAAA